MSQTTNLPQGTLSVSHLLGIDGLSQQDVLLILQTAKIDKRKWYYRVFAVILFIGLLISGLYQNILDHTEQKERSPACTLSDYEKLCQAKCYCNFAKSYYENMTYYGQCQEYQICHTCDTVTQVQTHDYDYNSTSSYCKFLKDAFPR